MTQTIGIIQSSYIPWKGYFDLINSSDEFVLFDSVQFTRRDWRSRNRIKSANGPVWLSIPVKVENRDQTIETIEVADHQWRRKHWASIEHGYAKSKYFDEYRSIFRSLYLESEETRLSRINFEFISAINRILGITTSLRWSSEFDLREGRTEKLVGICRDLNATTYISGPSAKAYLEEGNFHKHNIDVKWMDYSNYPEYPQPYPPFDHQVSILDLIFNVGSDATRYMKTFAEDAK